MHSSGMGIRSLNLNWQSVKASFEMLSAPFDFLTQEFIPRFLKQKRSRRFKSLAEPLQYLFRLNNKTRGVIHEKF